MVEQGTHKPLVVSSNLTPATKTSHFHENPPILGGFLVFSGLLGAKSDDFRTCRVPTRAEKVCTEHGIYLFF